MPRKERDIVAATALPRKRVPTEAGKTEVDKLFSFGKTLKHARNLLQKNREKLDLWNTQRVEEVLVKMKEAQFSESSAPVDFKEMGKSFGLFRYVAFAAMFNYAYTNRKLSELNPKLNISYTQLYTYLESNQREMNTDMMDMTVAQVTDYRKAVKADPCAGFDSLGALLRKSLQLAPRQTPTPRPISQFPE